MTIDSTANGKKWEERRNEALRLFSEGYSCAQAVLAACCEEYGLSRETAMALSAGLGGGVGATHDHLCGAVLGGVLFLGLRRGDTSPEAKKESCADVKAFLDDFAAENGALNCVDLIHQQGLKEKVAVDPRLAVIPGVRPCAKYVADAIDILAARETEC